MKKTLEVKDEKGKSFMTFYFDGDAKEQIALIKKYLFNHTLFLLHMAAFDYRNMKDKDIFHFSGLFYSRTREILHAATQILIEDISQFPPLVIIHIQVLRRKLTKILGADCFDKIKHQTEPWLDINAQAKSILDALGLQPISPVDFEESEDVDISWI
ncbi:MAG: hypothetical protein AAFQ83_05065 [Bacteroidota bacterium]